MRSVLTTCGLLAALATIAVAGATRRHGYTPSATRHREPAEFYQANSNSLIASYRFRTDRYADNVGGQTLVADVGVLYWLQYGGGASSRVFVGGPSYRMRRVDDAAFRVNNGTSGWETWTISSWVYPTSIVGVSVVCAWYGAGAGDQYWLGLTNGAPCWYQADAGIGTLFAGASAKVPVNEWTHLMIACCQGTSGDGNHHIYTNGVASAAFAKQNMTHGTVDGIWYVANNGAGLSGFAGFLDEVDFYQGAFITGATEVANCATGAAPLHAGLP